MEKESSVCVCVCVCVCARAHNFMNILLLWIELCLFKINMLNL